MSQNELKNVDTHFKFGENWSDYSQRIDETAIQQAEDGLLQLVPREALRDASFLDIGSGSGLHSLAASRLGARVTPIDIDPDSVSTTNRVLAAHGVAANARVVSVFEANELGQFDIVYSWGVLHHTGAMWQAVEAASTHVKPGGLFAIALYEKTPLCGPWRVEKKLFTAAPGFIQSAIVGVYGAAKLAALPLLGRNPVRYVKDYHKVRGMSFWHDVRDWVGGYPYESASVDETVARMKTLGFQIVKTKPTGVRLGILGTGCAEFLFRRDD